MCRLTKYVNSKYCTPNLYTSAPNLQNEILYRYGTCVSSGKLQPLKDAVLTLLKEGRRNGDIATII